MRRRMNCPECQSSDLKIYDSRHIGDYVVRKRKCSDCGDKFFTIEGYMSEEELAEIENLKKEKSNEY
jgi:transcriptional regulator NrdR family protein